MSAKLIIIMTISTGSREFFNRDIYTEHLEIACVLISSIQIKKSVIRRVF